MSNRSDDSQVIYPTDATIGAGAGPHFNGAHDAARNFSQSAGVCEGRLGIIELTHIDTLSESSKKGASLFSCLKFPPISDSPWYCR